MTDEVKPASALPLVKDQLQALAQKASDEGQHDVALDALRMLSAKPGVQTTEFYVSMICGSLGAVLQLVPGREVLGAILIAVATLAYNLSRGIAKKAPAAVGAFLAIVLLGGCSAEQLAKEEAAAHAALLQVEAGIDWLNANPATVDALLDDAAAKSSNRTLQDAVAKAKAAIAAGDLEKARYYVSVARAFTVPAPASSP